MNHPIPVEALDDRLAIVGTAGSGKTYLTIGSIERLLARNSRVISIDALGVQWGLRLKPDGKTPSPFDIVIFGGSHGDLPLNEHAGALIGETVATMRESCILDLSQIGTKAAERRFMLAFLTALYRHANKEPVHLVVDEADMWAPQKLLDKDGDAAKLLGMMETIVRRGRVKGFIPWLITQRPAVLSKDVLSQADGIIALKLTAQQDHAAVGGWIEATADTGQWKAIKGALATKQRGEGVLWIPSRNILEDVTFPANTTFDSSRTPKRGEKPISSSLQALDLTKLKEKLAGVETEIKANDPTALKAEVARLTKELAKKPNVGGKPDPQELADAEQRGFERGHEEGNKVGFYVGWVRCKDGARIEFGDMPDEAAPTTTAQTRTPPATPSRPVTSTTKAALSTSEPVTPSTKAPHSGAMKLLGTATRCYPAKFTWGQLAALNNVKARGGHFNSGRKTLLDEGLVEMDGELVTPTDAGFEKSDGTRPIAISASLMRDVWLDALPNPAKKMLEKLIEVTPARTISIEELASALNMKPIGGHWNTGLKMLRDNGLATVSGGAVRVSASLWTDHTA